MGGGVFPPPSLPHLVSIGMYACVCSFHFADHSTPSHSAVSLSQTSASLDDDEFSDFIQGPVETPTLVPPASSRPFQFCHPSQAGQWLSEKAVAQPLPPVQVPVSSILHHGTTGHIPYFSTSAASQNTQKTGNMQDLWWDKIHSVLNVGIDAGL